MKFHVKVNATAANVGAGFDCMGLALSLSNELIVSDETDRTVEIAAGEGVPKDENNLIFRSMREVFALTGREIKNIKIEQTDRIPMASGLGSSAACVAAGAAVANAMTGNTLSEQELINLCARIDGHPDNILPALVGGVTAGVMTSDGVEYMRADIGGDIEAMVVTPDFPFFTSESRKLLPDSYSRQDVIYSMSRAVLCFAALALGREEKLRCMDDRIHQPYRIPHISGYREAERSLKQAGAICVFLGGAGPSVIGIRKKTSTQMPTGLDNASVRLLDFANDPIAVRKI